MTRLALLLLLSLTALPAAAEPKLKSEHTLGAPTELPREVRKELKRGLKLLKRGDLVAFLDRFVHPTDRADMPPLEQVAGKFEGEKADRVRAAFQATLDGAPVYEVRSQDGSTGIAVEVLPAVPDLPRDMVLQVVDGRWYIRD